MADELWIDVLPSMRGFGATLTKEATGAAKRAGASAGKEYAGAFEDGGAGASDAAVRELETAEKRAAGLVSKLSGEVSKARQTQQKATADVITAEERYRAAVERGGEGSAGAEAAALRLEAARGKASDASQRFKNTEEALKEAQKGHKTTVEQLTDAQQKAGREVDQQKSKWGKFADGFTEAKDKAKGFATSLPGVVGQLAAVAGGAALAKEALTQAFERQDMTSMLTAQLAATPEQAAKYGAAAGNLYSQNYGESMSDVGDAVDAVVSSIKGLGDASQADIEKVTGYAMNLATAFDVDVAESAAVAGTMIKNGLAKDGAQAFDLMTASMQGVPKAMRGEILPVMGEYAKHFAALGIDGQTAMGMIAKGAQDGAIGMDKVGDSLKEFTIRGTDMSKSTSEAYKSMGLNTKQITNDLLAGGSKAEGALGKVVTGLQGIKDPGDQAAAAIALFGTPLEDLGTDKIPEFLSMIKPTQGALKDTAGTAQAMGENLKSGASNGLETLKRSFMTMLSEGIAPILEPLAGVLDWATKTPGVLQGVGIALGVVAIAWGALTLAASPWLAIALGIGAAIGGLVALVMNWGSVMDWLNKSVLTPFFGWVGQAWGGMVNGIRDLWNGVLRPTIDAVGRWFVSLWTGFVKPAVDWIVGGWRWMSDGIKTLWGGAVNGVRDLWNGVLKPAWDAVAKAASWLWNVALRAVFDGIRNGWKAAVDGISWVWNNVLRPAWDAVRAAGGFLRDTLGRIFGAIRAGWQTMVTGVKGIWQMGLKPIWDAVATAGRWLWNNILSPVFTSIKNGWKAAVDGIRAVWTGVLRPAWDGVRNAAGFMRDALGKAFGTIRSLWDGMINGIKGFWDKKLKPVFDAVSSMVKNTVVKAFETAQKGIKAAWTAIGNIVRKPVNFVIKTVYNDGLKSLFNGIAEKLGLGWRLPDVGEVPAFAKGGRHNGGWALVGEEGPELVNFSNPGRVYTAAETQAMLSGKEQAPEAALPMLAGSGASDSVLPVGGFWGDVWRGVTGVVGKAKDWVVGRIADGVRALTKPLKDGISTALPGSGINELIRGGAHNLIDGMTSWAVKKDDKKEAEQIAAGTFDGGGGGDFGTSGAVYQGALGAFHRPSKGPYTSMYGPRWGSFHAGVDIAGGGPTYAALPGKVARVGWNAVSGRTGVGIVLNHGPGLWTYYGHNPSLGAVKVRPGQDVKAGQRIGAQGATGNVTGTHLHFEVQRGRIGAAVNPMAYLHDQGGWLQPGLTQVLNKTGKPEAILNPNQWRTAERSIEHVTSAPSGGDVHVTISVEDLDGIRTLEEFIEMARRKGRQKKGR